MTKRIVRWWVGMALVVALPSYAQGVSYTDLARQQQYREVKISPDGKHIAAVAVVHDLPVLALVDLETGKGATVHPREGDQVVDFWWVNDHRVLYTIGTKTAGFDRPFSTGEIFAIDADGQDAANLFGYRVGTQSTGSHIEHATSEYASATMIDTLRDDENHVLIGVDSWQTGAEGAFTQVYRMDVRDGTKHLVTTAPLRNAGFVTDQHGAVRFAYGSNGQALGQVFYRASDGAPWTLLFTEDTTRGMPMPQRFNRDDTQVYMTCAAPGAVSALCMWDVASQTLGKPLWSSPSVDLDGLELSPDGRDVVGARSMPGMPSVAALVPDSATIKLIAAFSQQFPGEFTDVMSSTDDGSKAVVLVSSDRDPGTYYLWDAKIGKAALLFQRDASIKPAAMAAMQPIELKARDGLPLHGYLTRPPGQEQAQHMPLVVYVHGGPYGIHDDWTFDPYVQMLATHGYAVLQVNYRGSGGYGYGFQRAGYREWGGKMQDDVTDATQWAIAQGIAGSYGGYAALEGAVRQPDLYRCAIGYVGVYDLSLMYKRGDIPQSSMGKSYLHQALGDDQAVLAAHSPINQLDRLKAQVMLIVGGVDERVPSIQGQDLHHALLDRHIPHEWLYEADEGHGFYTEAHRAELFEQVVQFLDRNIGVQAAATASAH